MFKISFFPVNFLQQKKISVYCMDILPAISDGLVYLRRDVSVENEDGISYEIKICINDTSHNLQPEVCGLLSVTFNSKCSI